jgi:2-dehydro-3-deoxyphosphogluconate aldolase/(4S)-4-hydroxy-2-oxoglutarate aldolase
MSFDALITGQPIIPVIVIDDATAAEELVSALSAGGILIAEVTLRTDAALLALRRIADTESIIVGAGTVLTESDVDRVVDAGARFIVSPGFDQRVLERARERGIAALPGVATATEVQRALSTGVTHVKFFPAHRLGGLETIDALAAPFPDVKFIPSGGVDDTNAVRYLSHPSVPAVSGSWMCSRQLISDRSFDEIERRARRARELIHSD